MDGAHVGSFREQLPTTWSVVPITAKSPEAHIACCPALIAWKRSKSVALSHEVLPTRKIKIPEEVIERVGEAGLEGESPECLVEPEHIREGLAEA